MELTESATLREPEQTPEAFVTTLIRQLGNGQAASSSSSSPSST